MEKKTGKNNECVNPSSPVLASICLGGGCVDRPVNNTWCLLSPHGVQDPSSPHTAMAPDRGVTAKETEA